MARNKTGEHKQMFLGMLNWQSFFFFTYTGGAKSRYICFCHTPEQSLWLQNSTDLIRREVIINISPSEENLSACMGEEIKDCKVICQGLIRSNYASVKRNHRCFSVSLVPYLFSQFILEIAVFYWKCSPVFLPITNTVVSSKAKQSRCKSHVAPFSHPEE